MNSITINGKSVAYHFGLHFSEMFPKAIRELGQQFSRIDFITEAIVAAHNNYCKMKAEPRVIERHEVFAFAESMNSNVSVAEQVNIFMADYAQCDFAKAADAISTQIKEEEKKRLMKSTGKKSKSKPSE